MVHREFGSSLRLLYVMYIMYNTVLRVGIRPTSGRWPRSATARVSLPRLRRTTTRLDCTPASSDGGARNRQDARHRLRNPGRSLIRDAIRGRAPAASPALLALGCSGLLGISLQLRVNQSLAAPHADDRHHGVVTAIDDPIRGHLEFAKPGRIELGDNPTAIREQCELTDALQDGPDQTLAHLPRMLRRVPCDYVQQVVFRGLRELHAEPLGHQSRSKRRLTSSSDPTRSASMSARPATTARIKSRSCCRAS